jgi:hypothetical protein
MIKVTLVEAPTEQEILTTTTDKITDPSKKSSTTTNPTVEEGPTAETAVECREGILPRVTKIPPQRTMRRLTVETATM